MSFIDDLMEDLAAAKRPGITKKPWMLDKVMELVTAETIKRVIDECIAAKVYALDLETTGLDNRVYSGRTLDQIVGACLSPDGVRGYYIPVRHLNAARNLPVTLFESELRRLIRSDSVAVFHNARFDQEFLQFSGGEPIGTFDDAKKWDDTIILKYLSDSRAKNKGLKHLAKVELDMEMIELEELFTTEEMAQTGHNFAVLDPEWEPALWYACSDAICTYLLRVHLYSKALDPTPSGLPGQKDVYNIEKACLPATRWMERNRIHINKDKVEELIRVGQREWLPALTEVYEACSKVLGRDIAPGFFKILSSPDDPLRFDPEDISSSIMERIQRARAKADERHMDPTEMGENNKVQIATIQKTVAKLDDTNKTESVAFQVVYDVLIPEEIGALFRELGVPGLEATAGSGKEDAAGRTRAVQVKTSKDVIEEILDEHGEEFPYLSKVKRFREVAKALATNLQPIYDTIRDPVKSPDGRIRINFNPLGTDTGRFSTPKDKEHRGWYGKTNWNLHSIPATYDKGRPECMKRIREIINAIPGRFIVAIDFSGQELRLITNLSGEPKWEAEFFRCSACEHKFDRGATVPPPPEAPPPFCPKCGSDKIGDLHSLTALSVFGEEIKKDPKLYKDKRSIAKNINFGLSYGGGPNAIMRVTGCTKDEGYRIKRQFDGSYKVLQAWWKTQHEYAKKHKAVVTAFCRRYPLPDIDSEMGGFRSKAERNAVNGPIQGTGADLMKYSMALVYKEFKKRGWLDKALMILTIHDELVFEVDGDILSEMIDVTTDIMLRKTTQKKAWRVPLTADVEVGYDWTVPWNISHIRHGKEDMPPELEGIIQVGQSNREPDEPVAAQPHQETATPAVEGVQNFSMESQAAPAQEASREVVREAQLALPEHSPAPASTSGGVYTYRIERRLLTMSFAARLAQVIEECYGRGPNPLRLEVLETNQPIEYGGPIYVNPVEFNVLLNRKRAT